MTMKREFYATLIDPVTQGQLEFFSDTMDVDCMVPRHGQLSKPLFLSRIADFDISHQIVKQNLGLGALKLGAMFAPGKTSLEAFAVGALPTDYVDRVCGKVWFLGNDRAYLLIASPEVFDRIERILTERNYYGHYREKFPGLIYRGFMDFMSFLNAFNNLIKGIGITLACITVPLLIYFIFFGEPR